MKLKQENVKKCYNSLLSGSQGQRSPNSTPNEMFSMYACVEWMQ